MKRFILGLVLVMAGGMALAAEQCNDINSCGYTSSMEYLIKDAEGNVVDRDKWEQFQGTSRLTAYRAKYLLLSHIYSIRAGDTEPAVFIGLQRILNGE